MRVQFNEGQEVIRADLNKLQAARQREFYDRFIYELMGRTSDAFFEGSFKVTYVDSNTIQVAKGFGLQTDLTQVSPEPVRRPLYLSADTNSDITSPHATLNRIDIVSVKNEQNVTSTESRRYKSTLESLPTTQSFDIETDWESDIVVTAGTPDASPVAPSTPSGYIKISEIVVTASTGIASQSAITDTRTLLPSFNRAFAGYAAIVGSSGFCTHSTLAAAISAVSAGDKILVVSNLTITTTVTVNKNNLLIEGAPGVTLTNSAAGTGIIIDADGVRIRSLRFSGFTTGIQINDTQNLNFITECRFSSVTTDIDDQNTTPNNVLMMNLTE